MSQQIMKMIDKSVVRNNPDINKLMGCIDNSFSGYTFLTFIFLVNKQVRWKKYLKVREGVQRVLDFTGEHEETMFGIHFVFEDKNICYRYDNSGIKKKWTFDKENSAD